jgi:iron(III) transport system ATP-binding protein
VTGILDTVGIAHLRNEYSTRLSGGQQQRIALARCLVNDPEVILFDEPLSNVDAKVREELRVELLAMQRRIGFAGVYVTHDQEEAMAISDRIVVMREGKAVQIGTPREIYRMPASRFVASFIGVVNLWPGRIEGTDSGDIRVVRTDVGDIPVARANVPGEGYADGSAVDLVVRPEALSVARQAPGGPAGPGILPGILRAEMFRGSHTDLFVEVGRHIVRARADDETGLQIGDAVNIVVPAQKVRALPAADRAASADEMAERSAIEAALARGAAESERNGGPGR